MKKALITLLIIWNLVFSPVTLAANSQFRIDLGVTGAPDVTPPSQPTNLAATAVSTSQINLSWNPSIDNVSILAYRVYRSGIFIATSTSVTYSNTGLSANTIYMYTVSAVDTSGNESSQSAPASAQTLKGANGGGGGVTVFSIYDVVITPGEKTVVIEWKTYTPTQGTITWGTTGEYKDEVIKEAGFGILHKVTLNDLIPGTQYFFQIEALTEGGVTYILKNQSFLTSGLEEGIPNVSSFKAIPTQSTINLSWNNPKDPNFGEVRIIRNPNFFPSDYLDGKVVYQGKGESFIDSDVESGETYYYTLFVKDINGNYSSGMVSLARVGANPNDVVPDVYDNLPKAPYVNPIIEALTFADFDFIQDGKKINPVRDSQINIDGTKNLTISLQYKKIPEVLKSIIVTLKDPEDPKKVFSFILKVNKEKTLYSATIAPLGRTGVYATRIAIVDYKNRGLKATDGQVIAQLALTENTGSDSSNRSFWIILILLALTYVAHKIEKFIKERKRRKLTNA